MKGDKPNNIIGIDKDQLEGDFIFGSILNGIREPIWYSFALDETPGQKIFEKARI